MNTTEPAMNAHFVDTMLGYSVPWSGLLGMIDAEREAGAKAVLEFRHARAGAPASMEDAE